MSIRRDVPVDRLQPKEIARTPQLAAVWAMHTNRVFCVLDHRGGHRRSVPSVDGPTWRPNQAQTPMTRHPFHNSRLRDGNTDN